MNSDYRIKIGFFRHYKTRKLEKRLGETGVLALLKLWEYAAEFRPDGDLSGMSDEDIELAINWMQETPLMASLANIGFIDGQAESYSLHDWQEHNPWVSDTQERGDTARLSRLFRKNPEAAKQLKAQGRTGITQDEYRQYERSTSVVRPHNERSTNAVRTAVAPAPAPAPAPSPTPTPTPYVERSPVRVDAGIAPVAPDAGSPLEGEILPAVIAKPLKTEAKSNPVWDAYATAYQDRYGVPPVRNAKVNSQLCQVVDRLGAEAPAVAGFYLRHNSEWYVKHAHAAQYLLNDAEKLRTEWATRRQITTKAAREADQRQTTSNSYDRLEAKYSAIDAQRHQEAAHAH